MAKGVGFAMHNIPQDNGWGGMIEVFKICAFDSDIKLPLALRKGNIRSNRGYFMTLFKQHSNKVV